MSDRERLAIAINALASLAGHPELDEDLKRITGEDPATTPSVRLARKTLARIGYVSNGPPVAQRWDN